MSKGSSSLSSRISSSLSRCQTLLMSSKSDKREGEEMEKNKKQSCRCMSIFLLRYIPPMDR